MVSPDLARMLRTCDITYMAKVLTDPVGCAADGCLLNASRTWRHAIATLEVLLAVSVRGANMPAATGSPARTPCAPLRSRGVRNPRPACCQGRGFARTRRASQPLDPGRARW